MRVTPQRVGVWRLLAGSGEHYTPEEVRGRTRGDLPGMELSTVYRVLEVLRRVGLVAESRLPEGARVFEAGSSLQPHLVCERCGWMIHPGSETAKPHSRLAGPDLGGFRAREVHVVAVGPCVGCAEG